MEIKDKNLYYVGGFVRDEILGVANFDIDYCYEGNAINFAQDLNIIKTNKDFGTVRVLLNNQEIDIASTRTEVYNKNGHLPVIKEIGCELKEDLKRRDFTINALAKNTLTKEIVDYFDGLEDIKNKKIRVLHNKSFLEDPSRIIRALKFSVRFNFELEENTYKLQKEYLENINYDVSYHRLKKELKETFSLNKQEALDIFIEENIYKLLGPNQVKPNITCDVESLITKYKPNNIYMVYLGLFDLSKFELTTEELRIIKLYNEIKEKEPTNNYEIYNLFNKAPLESILLYAITKDVNIAKKYLDNLYKIKISISGNDLKNLGIKQGKIYNEIFEFLLEQKVNNPSLTQDRELFLVKERFLK